MQNLGTKLNPMAGVFHYQPNNITPGFTLNASQVRQLQQNMSDPGNYAPNGVQPIFNIAPTNGYIQQSQNQPFRFVPRYSSVSQQLQPEFAIPLQNFFGPLATQNI